MALSLAESRSTTLYLYRDGVAVSQSRAMACPVQREGANAQVQVRLENISNLIEDSSFILTGPEELLRYSVQHSSTQPGSTLHTALTGLLGEEVELISLRTTVEKVEEMSRSGRLIQFVPGQHVILQDTKKKQIQLIEEPIVEVRSLAALPDLQHFSTATYIDTLLHTHCGDQPITKGRSGTMDMSLLYHSRGLLWNIVYDVLVQSDYSSMSITGKLEVGNETGVSFAGARVFVVYGLLFPSSSSSRMMEEEEQPRGLQSMRSLPKLEPEPAEFTTYELPQVVDIPYLGQYRQQYVSFFEQPDIKVKRYYVLDTAEMPYARLLLRWLNNSFSGAGVLFPPGHYSVMRTQEGLGVEPLGETQLPALPIGRQVDMRLGPVHSIRGVKEELRSIQKGIQQGKLFRSNEYQVTLFNEKEEAIHVRLLEHLQQDDWTMKDSYYVLEKPKKKADFLFSAVPQKPNSDKKEMRLAEAVIPVPARSKTVVHYVVEYREPALR